MDVPVDFSNALFICTANDEGAISGPLRDRMDIIRISGYDIPEKIAIAKKYLIPKAFVTMGLKQHDEMKIDVTDGALDLLVRQYCRESGVRNLERHVEMLSRKIAFKVVSEAEENELNHVSDQVGGDSVAPLPLPEENIAHEVTARQKDEAQSNSKLNSVDVVNIRPKVNIKEMSILITENNLVEYVGQPRFSQV